MVDEKRRVKEIETMERKARGVCMSGETRHTRETKRGSVEELVNAGCQSHRGGQNENSCEVRANVLVPGGRDW